MPPPIGSRHGYGRYVDACAPLAAAVLFGCDGLALASHTEPRGPKRRRSPFLAATRSAPVPVLDGLAAPRADGAVEADVDPIAPGPAVDQRDAARIRVDHVVPGTREHAVVPVADEADGVDTGAAVDHVRAPATLQVVVAVSAVDRVAAAPAVDRVVAGARSQAVRPVGGARGQPVAPEDVVARVTQQEV